MIGGHQKIPHQINNNENGLVNKHKIHLYDGVMGRPGTLCPCMNSPRPLVPKMKPCIDTFLSLFIMHYMYRLMQCDRDVMQGHCVSRTN